MTRTRRALLAPVLFLLIGGWVQALPAVPAHADSLAWVREFHFDDGTWMHGVATDSSGVYVVGESFFSGGHGSNGFLTKYDFNGNRLWSQFHFGPGYDPVYSVAAGSSGVYVLAAIHSPHAIEWRLCRYHRNGGLAWSLSFDQATTPAGLAVDASGVYVVGDVGFAPRHSAAARYSFVTKFSSAGERLSYDRFGASSAATGVAVGPNGVTVVGTTTEGLWGYSSAGGTDAYARQYSPAGQLLWTRQFGTTGDDRATAVAADATGEYVVGGTGNPSQTSFVRKFDTAGQSSWHHRLSSDQPVTEVTSAIPSVSGPGVDVAGDGGDLSGGTSTSVDGFVREYDAGGAVTFTHVIGTDANDELNGIAGFSGSLYVAGTTAGAFPGYPSPHFDDAFVSRLA
jgi:hypothetical protein